MTIQMKHLLAATAVAVPALITLNSCGYRYPDAGIQTEMNYDLHESTELERAAQLVEDAQAQCDKDSVDFYAQAKDSTAAKQRLQLLQQLRQDFFRLGANDTENVGMQMRNQINETKEYLGEDVPPDHEIVAALDINIREAQKKVDIATGKVYNWSKMHLANAKAHYEQLKQEEAERLAEEARQDSIIKAETVRNDSIRKAEKAWRDSVNRAEKELLKQEIETALRMKYTVDSLKYEEMRKKEDLIDIVSQYPEVQAYHDSIANEIKKVIQ